MCNSTINILFLLLINLFYFIQSNNTFSQTKTEKISRGKENPIRNYNLKLNSNSNYSYLFIYTYIAQEDPDNKYEYATIRTIVRNKIFFSNQNSHFNAIIIPREYYSDIQEFKLDFQCRKYCLFNLTYSFTNIIELEIGQNFWFTMMENLQNIPFSIKSDKQFSIFLQGKYNTINWNLPNETVINDINTRYLIKQNNISFNINSNIGEYIYIYTSYHENVFNPNINSQIYFGYFNKDETFYFNNGENEKNIKYFFDILLYNKSSFILNYYDDIEDEEKEKEIKDINNFSEIFYSNYTIKFNNSGIFILQHLDIGKLEDATNIVHKLFINKKIKDELLENEIRFYQPGQFYNNNSILLLSINKLKGNMNVYTDICLTYPLCLYNKSNLIEYKEENKDNFSNIYPINNKYNFYINSSDYYKTNQNYPFIIIVECIDEECFYEISFIYENKIYFEFNNNNNNYENFKYLKKNKIDEYNFKFYDYINKYILLSIYIYSGSLNFNYEIINEECNLNKEKEFNFYNIKKIIFKSGDSNNNNNHLSFQLNINISSNENVFYSFFINTISDNNNRIILPNIQNIFIIPNNEFFTFNYLPNFFNEAIIYTTLFKPLKGEINININNDNKNLPNEYNNIYIHSILENIYSYNYKIQCISNNENNCIFSIITQSSLENNFIFLLYLNNYVLIDLNHTNINILFPITSFNNTYYFNYIYNNTEDLINITQSFSNLNITEEISGEKAQNYFDISNVYLNEFSEDNLMFFKIEIIKNINDHKEYFIEINLQNNNSYYPNVLIQNEIKVDFFGDRKYKYFILPLNKDDNGIIYFNLEKGCGKLSGIINNISFDINTINNNYLENLFNFNNTLYFDDYNQKIEFESNFTKDCNQNCYLLLITESYHIYENNANNNFSLVTKLNNKEVYLYPEINIFGDLYNKTNNTYHLFKIYISYTFFDMYFDFQSNEGIIELYDNVYNENKKFDTNFIKENIILKNYDFSDYHNKYLIIKIYSNFSLYNNIYYRLKITSNQQFINSLKCDNIYYENNNLFSFYDNQQYENKITCFSNCEYCKIEDYDQYNNLKCINCALKHVSILYDNENINQTHCLDYCTINYFEYFNRTCEKVENHILYCLENQTNYTGSNFTSYIYYYNNSIENNITSTIYLNECEKKLKNNSTSNESLIIYKIDFNQTDINYISQIEYMIFDHNGNKLDLSICEEDDIIISIPLNITKFDNKFLNKNSYLKSFDYDIFNPNDSFYNDICSQFKSENGQDVILQDRKINYYENFSLCEENCNYLGFDEKNYKINCSCKIKKNTSDINKKFVDNKISNNFYENTKQNSFKILKCSNLFNSDLFSYNFGFYLSSFVLIGESISIICFYNYIGFNYLNNLLSNNKLFQKFNLKLEKLKKKQEMKNIKKMKKKKRLIKNGLKDLNSVFNSNANPPIKNKKIDINESKNQKNEQDFEISIKNKEKPKSLKKLYFNLENNQDKSSDRNLNEQNDELFKKNNNVINYINTNKNKQNNIKIYNNINQNDKEQMEEKIIIHSNEDLNKMDYKNSLLYDKRNFIDIYYSFLKVDQLFLYAFKNNTDSNLSFLKIQLFFYSLILYFTFNICFYSQNDISYNYYHNGKINYGKKLTDLFFIILICDLIIFILKQLISSQKFIKKLMTINEESKFEDEINFGKNIIKIKIVIFQIIIILSNIFFIYYISIFIAVYKNTQKNIIILYFINLIISMIYPLLICAISASLRIFSLSHDIKCIFIMSQIFQIL